MLSAEICHIDITLKLPLQLRRVTSDVQHLRESNSSCKSTIEIKDRQLGESKERERQCNVQFLQSKSQLKEVSDECKRLSSVFAERDSRYSHDVKRIENETCRLKEKLSKMLGEKVNSACLNDTINSRTKYGTSTIPAWIEMTSLICNPDNVSRGKWRTEVSAQKREEVLSGRIIEEQQEKQEQLISENSELRESYYQFQYGLVKVLRECDSLPQEISLSSNGNYGEEFDAMSEMGSSILLPLDISREQLIDTSEKVIQNVADALKRRDTKIDKLLSLLKDYQIVVDKLSPNETEEAIKFILKHKEILQEEEENNHNQKRALDRKETELKIAETEFNIYKEKNLIDDLKLSIPIPLSNVSHIGDVSNEGPNWSLGKVHPTLPPSGKQNVHTTPGQGLKIGCFPTDALHITQSKRSSVSSKPRSYSHENEKSRTSLSPNRILSPTRFEDATVTFIRRSLNAGRSSKPRPRSTNMSLSPQRLVFPQRGNAVSLSNRGQDGVQIKTKYKTGNSGSVSDTCSASVDKISNPESFAQAATPR